MSCRARRARRRMMLWSNRWSKLPEQCLVILIRLYRACLSPLLPPSCRYEPSCSAYALEALRRHGFWRGLRLAGARLLRCHPFHAGGYDPVP